MLVVYDFSDLFSWLFHYFYGKQFFRALDCENKDSYALLQPRAEREAHKRGVICQKMLESGSCWRDFTVYYKKYFSMEFLI